MSMQMIGRRSISVRSEFSCGSWYWGRRLCPPSSPYPLIDKRGPAPVDNGSMALRMQAQASALFEFVAFCLCLSSATLLFRVLFQLRTVLSTRLFGLEASRMQSAICNHQFGGLSSPPASVTFLLLPTRASVCQHCTWALLRAFIVDVSRVDQTIKLLMRFYCYIYFDFAFYLLINN
jgi:hypothetical protein